MNLEITVTRHLHVRFGVSVNCSEPLNIIGLPIGLGLAIALLTEGKI
jgi:hypothetical protein